MTATAPPPPPAARWRRRLRVAARRIAWGAGTLVVAWFAFAAWIESAGIYEPPPLPEGHASRSPPAIDQGGDFVRCGPSWIHRQQGIGEILLVGDAAARGHAMAALTRDDLTAQEDALFGELDRLLPGALRRYFVRKGVLFLYRDLPARVDDSFEIEAAAMAAELSRTPRSGPGADFPEYHRALFYQTLYDTGQSMAEAGIVDAEIGCTSFAATGDATKARGLIVGRNCDFEAGEVFDERKLVQFVVPDSDRRYVSVSWAGMMGVVTGVNDAGLFVALHAARTERTRWPRCVTPVPFLLRDALLHDATIEEVAERFRRTPDHAAAIVLVAETATGRLAVIETDPDRTVVVRSADDVLVAANTLRAPEWRTDEVVRATLRAGSSPLRQARMEELVAASRGRIDAVAAARILRDRRGAGGADAGIGNRTAISALIAAHAVVYDAAAGHLHVSRAPRGTGEFVTYDVRRFFLAGVPGSRADLLVPGAVRIAATDDGTAARVRDAREILRAAASGRAAGNAATALASAQRAQTLLDDSPESLLEVAECLRVLGRTDEARAAARRALGRQPVPGPERDRLVTLAALPSR